MIDNETVKAELTAALKDGRLTGIEALLAADFLKYLASL